MQDLSLHLIDIIENSARANCDLISIVIGIDETENKLSFEARNFCEALTSVLEARGKRYMMMNVPKGTLEKVKEIVPGLDGPTVLDLYGNTDVVAVHVVIEASKLNDVIPLLRDLGVHGILVSHIERLMP